MSGLDINSMDDKWKKYAQDADNAERESDTEKEKGNGILGSVFEKQTFIKLARADHKTDQEIKDFFKDNGADMDDINAIFQLELSNTKAQQSTVSKKSIERANNAAQTEIISDILQNGSGFYTNSNGTLKDTADWNGIANAFIKFYSDKDTNSENKMYYQKLAKEVQNVANLMGDIKYNNRSDVEAIYKNVESKLSKLPKDEFSDFRERVLRSFAILAESHQKSKEQQKINWAFRSLRQKGKSREEAYEAIKNDNRFKGSYYTSYQHLEYADQFGGNSKKVGYNGLIKGMENSVILEDARKEVYDAVWAQRGKSHLTTSKQIENEAEKLIHQDKYTDKIMHKNLRGEMSFKQRIEGENSRYKDVRKAVAAYNRVENNKVKAYSRDDFYKGAFKGKSGDMKFNQLSKSGDVVGSDGKPLTDKNDNPIKYNPLITQAVDANGKPMTDKNGNPLYNLSKISDIIKHAISPADMKANYEADKESSFAEIKNVIRDIYTATTVYDPDDNTKIIQEGITISYEDACHLIDMCGFERDKWTVGYALRTLEKAAIDTVSDIAATAATALIVGAAQGDPLVHVEQAITHVTDPKAHAVTNIDEITKALLGMSKSLGTINPNNGVNLMLNWRVNVKVNGETIDVDSQINDYDIYRQLDQQLAEFNLPDDAYGIEKGSDGFWHLWLNIPSDTPYEDIRSMYEVLSENFDLKTDTGVPFEAKAVIDEKGQVVTDKEAEAVVDEKGEAKTTNKLQAFLWGTAIGFGLNVLKECLKGLKNTDIDLTQTLIEENDLAHYEARISKERISKVPGLKDALLNIAKLFKNPDGSWDKAGYQSFLNELAGNRSKLNSRELEIGILKYQKEHEPSLSTKEKTEKPEEKTKPQETATVETPPEKPKYKVTPKTVSIQMVKGDKYLPTDMAKLYVCQDEKVMARALKVVQGITDTDFSAERINNINKYSNAILAKKYTVTDIRRDESGRIIDATTIIKTKNGEVRLEHFDANKYRHVLTYDEAFGDFKLPSEVAGCQRKNLDDLKNTFTGTPNTKNRSSGVSGSLEEGQLFNITELESDGTTVQKEYFDQTEAQKNTIVEGYKNKRDLVE